MPDNVSRRRFLKTVLGLGAAGLAAGAGGYGYTFHIEPEMITVERLTIPVANLPNALEGFKIVQLSDLHLYPYTQLEMITAAVTQINRLQPDVVVLTGDYVLSSAEAIFDLAPALAGLNPRHGIFASLGNHDIWTNVAVVQQGMREAGLQVLRNRGVSLPVGHNRLYLAGLDDVWSGRPDLPATLANAPANVPVVLLAHEPDIADITARDGRVSLQLSGHSHGGQVRLPGYGPLVLPRYGRKYELGLYRVGATWLYTNRGLGVIGPPLRFNCPPEISEFTLVQQT